MQDFLINCCLWHPDRKTRNVAVSKNIFLIELSQIPGWWNSLFKSWVSWIERTFLFTTIFASRHEIKTPCFGTHHYSRPFFPGLLRSALNSNKEIFVYYHGTVAGVPWPLTLRSLAWASSACVVLWSLTPAALPWSCSSVAARPFPGSRL